MSNEKIKVCVDCPAHRRDNQTETSYCSFDVDLFIKSNESPPVDCEIRQRGGTITLEVIEN